MSVCVSSDEKIKRQVARVNVIVAKRMHRPFIEALPITLRNA
jgi:polysaccharide pyruvyl transferase WcaK-like protein